MAINATDNKLRFLSGLSTNLSKVDITNGNVYVTTDEHIMYADLGGKRLRLSDIVMVNTTADLPTYPPEERKTALYYVRKDNILCCYNTTESTSGWVQINAAPVLENIIASSETVYSEVVVGEKAKAKLSLYDKNGTDVTENFSLIVASGNTATTNVNADSNGIVITSADTITSNSLAASAASNVATITLGETKSGYNADGTAKTANTTNHTLKLNNNGGVAITTTGSDQINLNVAPESITNAFDSNGSFTTTIQLADGDEVSSTGITPVIKYGYGAVKATAQFANGTATLSDLYTKTEVDAAITAQLKTANAMTFVGSVGGTTNLPVANSGVAVGDTYIVSTAGDIKNTSGTLVQTGAKVGDLFIATGTETDGKITSNLEWKYVPAGNDDLYQYSAVASDSKFTLVQSFASEESDVGAIAIGDGLTGSANGTTLTIAHPTKTVSAKTSSASLSAANTTQTFSAISGVTYDDYGHVTAITTSTYSVANHALASITYSASAASNVATVKTVVAQESGEEVEGSFSVQSNNLTVTASSSTVTIDLVWGEFA